MMSYILDGVDVSREMAQDPELKDLPVIMVTALKGVTGSQMFPTDEYVAVDEWLSKPVAPDELLDRVREALA
jgi:CheY-like chemotaxis protein